LEHLDLDLQCSTTPREIGNRRKTNNPLLRDSVQWEREKAWTYPPAISTTDSLDLILVDNLDKKIE
jgi:hypothetical protein